MVIHLSPEKMWDLYNKIPKELQNYVFSTELEELILKICSENKIEDDSTVMRLIQNVLLGILPLERFQKEASESLKIDSTVLEKINKSVFAPVKISIEKLYNKSEIKEENKKSSNNDIYREPVN